MSDDLQIPTEIVAVGASAAEIETAQAVLRGELDDNAWMITSMGAAAWAMTLHAQAQRQIDETAKLAAQYRAAIDVWYENATRPARRTVTFMEERLMRFGLSERERAGGKVKSIVLPSGSIRTTDRRDSTRIVVDNADELVKWLRVNDPDAVKTTYSPLVSKITAEPVFVDGSAWGKLIAGADEIVPGCHVERGEISAKVDHS